MALDRISLTDFRNHAATELEATTQFNLLVGENGAGKTNILEALSLLAPGRGLRRAALADLVRSGGETGFGIGASLRQQQGEAVRLATYTDSPLPARRRVRINGADSSATGLGEWMAVTWLTPAMDRIFNDSAAGRRRFLDHLASGLESAHATRVSAYERTMRQRSKVLREPGWDSRWVMALEVKLAELGTAIAAQRLDYIARLGVVMAEGGSPASGATIAVQGDVEEWLEAGPAIEAEARFREALSQGRDRDAAVGGASTGPHRSDLELVHAGGMPAAQCSTGEQKTLLFAIVEADARLVATAGRSPLLLLDEVSAHLDEERRANMFDAALGIGAQVWATGTDRALFEGLEGRAQFFVVGDGHVVAE